MHIRTRIGVVACSLAAALTLPATASAITTVRASEERPGPPRTESTFADIVLQGDDGPSDLTIEREEARLSDGRVIEGGVRVSDPYGVVPGENCASVPDSGGTSVLCQLSGFASVSGDMTAGGDDDSITIGMGTIDVDAGAGDDVVSGASTALGGPGDDELGAQLMDGGPGADVLGDEEFGPGLIDLSRRTEPVQFSLVEGEEGQGDRLVDVAGVIGGRADDVLTGSANDDIMLGGPGDDVLDGAGGDDQLADWEGRNTLDGGEGDDALVTDRASRVFSDLRSLSPLPDGPPLPAQGRALLLAGPGDDTVISGPGADRLDPGEGRDTVTTFVPAISGGADTVWLRDDDPDTLICDRRSAVRADSRDHLARCERIERTGAPRPRLLDVGARGSFTGNRGGSGTAFIGCSDDFGRRCRGLVRVYALGREVGRERFSIAPGTFDATVRFPLDRSVFDAVGERDRLRSSYRVDTRDARGRPVVLRGRQTLCTSRDISACREP